MIWFIVTYMAWGVSEVYLSLFRRAGESVKQKSDKGSLGLIWAIVIVANFLSYFVSRWVPAPIADDQNIRYVGLALIILGVILRFTIVSSLGKFFTVNVVIAQDHKLKTDGFYKYLRHPSYSASIVSFAGYGVSLNNWISLAMIVAAISTALLIRIRIEEETLINHFGEEYATYRKKTKKLIPFIY
jgi:protein-S-isoprenylcysteine O-methyltransferase Ste14